MKSFIAVYDNSEESNDQGEGDKDKGASDKGASDKGVFTDDQQKRVDKIVEERLARERKKQEPVIAELEQLKKNHDLSVKDRETLNKQIKTMQQAHMSKEEIALQAKQELEDRLQRDLEGQREETERWQTLYTDATIERAIADEAVSAEAYRPKQIVSLLRSNTELIKELKADGNETGNLVPSVTLMGHDAEGKAIEMKLTVKDAIKQMKEDKTGDFSNLFKSGLTGGVGGNTVPGDSGVLTDERVTNMSQAEYLKNREAIKAQ